MPLSSLKCHKLFYLAAYTYHNLCITAFESAGVDITKPLVIMCLGGMVSPLVSFALSLIGITTPVYDVSCIVHVMPLLKHFPVATLCL